MCNLIIRLSLHGEFQNFTIVSRDVWTWWSMQRYFQDFWCFTIHFQYNKNKIKFTEYQKWWITTSYISETWHSSSCNSIRSLEHGRQSHAHQVSSYSPETLMFFHLYCLLWGKSMFSSIKWAVAVIQVVGSSLTNEFPCSSFYKCVICYFICLGYISSLIFSYESGVLENPKVNDFTSCNMQLTYKKSYVMLTGCNG